MESKLATRPGYETAQRNKIVSAVNEARKQGKAWKDALAVAKQEGYRGASVPSLIGFVEAAGRGGKSKPKSKNKGASKKASPKSASELQPKRGPGRPKGSKNHKKADAGVGAGIVMPTNAAMMGGPLMTEIMEKMSREMVKGAIARAIEQLQGMLR